VIWATAANWNAAAMSARCIQRRPHQKPKRNLNYKLQKIRTVYWYIQRVSCRERTSDVLLSIRILTAVLSPAKLKSQCARCDCRTQARTDTCP
jgi:hypothetical protein